MKNFFAVVFAALVCVGVRASDDQASPAANGQAPALRPPAPAGHSFELQATGLSIPQTNWSELLELLQPIESDDTDEGLSVFAGETELIRNWIDEQLRRHQAILSFDTLGRTHDRQAWQFELGQNETRIRVPRLDDSGSLAYETIAGIKTGPRLQITPVLDNSLDFEIAYRPAVFNPSGSEDPADNGHEFRSGRLVMPHAPWIHYSLVLATDMELDPLPFVVVTGRNADENVTYTGTESRRAIDPLVESVRRAAAPPSSEPVPIGLKTRGNVSASVDVDHVQQPDVSTAGNYIQLTPGNPQTIELHEGESRRVSLAKNLKRVHLFNPDVIEVTASGKNELHIRASRAGATRITIVDEDDVPLELTVIVTEDMTDLELLLERLYPDAEVEVVPIRDTVLLRGTVDDAEQMGQIVEIAEQFAPTVLNQLSVAGVSTSAVIPSGYRVVTVNADVDVDVLEPGEHVDVIVTYQEYDDAGEPVRNYSEALLTGVEVYSVKTQTIGVGGAQSAQKDVTALLLRPDEAEAMNFVQDYFQSRCIQLVWHASAEVGTDSRLNREVLSELRRKMGLETLVDAGEYPPPPEPARDSTSELEDLRDEIRTLHEDVRRLIEVLEDRQSNETNANTSPSTPAIDKGAAMLFFDASWCGPCQRMRPIVSRLRNDGFAIQAIDIDEQRELVREFHVTSIPSFILLYDGKEVERLVGATTENELRNRLARASSPEYRTETESLGRVWTELGLQIEETAPDDERMSNSQYRGAVQITRVRAGSPASAAGLRTGDLLVGLHLWETISRENVEYVLDRASSGTFSPLKFYVLRDGETLSGHFPHGERASLEYPRQINHSVDTGPLPIAATTAEAVDLLPLPAGPAQPVDDESDPEPVN